MYFLIDIDRAEFASIDIKATYVTRLGRTFLRRQHTKDIDKKLVALALQTSKTKTLPTNSELLPVLGTIAKDIITNPKQAVARGLARERLVKEVLASQNIQVLPKTELILQGGKEASNAMANYVKNNKKDLAVNTVGTAASFLGASTGIPGAKYAGDLGGALVTRKAIQDVTATKNAIRKLRTDVAFKEASSLDKLKQLRNQSLSELKEMIERGDIKKDKIDDVGGFLVGNAVAESAQKVGAGIPLIGASGAMTVAKDIQNAAKRIELGESKKQVIADTLKTVFKKPHNLLKKGQQREQRVRDKVNNYLRGQF